MKGNLEVIVCKLKPNWYTYNATEASLYNPIPKEDLGKTYTLKGFICSYNYIYLGDKHTSPFTWVEDERPIACFSLHHFDIILRKPYVKEISNPA